MSDVSSEVFNDMENKKIKNINIIVKDLIISKKRAEATEAVVSVMKSCSYIYTTRSDLKTEMWIYKNGIYVPEGKTHIKELCRKLLGNSFTTTFANDVIAKVEADTYIDSDDFFDNNIIDEVPLKNGILNIITKELTEFTPKKIFFGKLPIIYNPSKQCPAIKKHFSTILKNSDNDVTTMFELFGYLLYKENKFEKAVMFSGNGRNGKSKTLELMRKFIGVENCSFVSLQKLNDDPYAPAELHRKMANVGGDISSKPMFETATFKGLTGRDKLSVQRKFLPMLHFVNYSKLIFAANQIPRPGEDSDAYWSRWLFFEFPYQFISEKEYNKKSLIERPQYKICDEDIINKIGSDDELSGLLNESLIALKRLLKNKTFSDDTSQKELREKWLRKSDSFRAFSMDNIEIGDFDDLITSQELKKQYSDYCHLYNLKPVGDKSIKYIIENEFGGTKEQKMIKDKYTYCWLGINFKT